MNKTILIGVGAVAAFLLYRKFMAKPKVEETEAADEQVEEQTQETSDDSAPAGGGGGGGGAAAPATTSAAKPTAKPTTKKGLQLATKARPPQRIKSKGSFRPIGVKPMRPQGMSVSMKKPMARPVTTQLASVKANKQFAGFMDFDGFPDVQASIM